MKHPAGAVLNLNIKMMERRVGQGLLFCFVFLIKVSFVLYGPQLGSSPVTRINTFRDQNVSVEKLAPTLLFLYLSGLHFHSQLATKLSRMKSSVPFPLSLYLFIYLFEMPTEIQRG